MPLSALHNRSAAVLSTAAADTPAAVALPFVDSAPASTCANEQAAYASHHVNSCTRGLRWTGVGQQLIAAAESQREQRDSEKLLHVLSDNFLHRVCLPSAGAAA